jgi:hypothetical protein
MAEGYIYLLIEREFIKTNENIYKIGKTKQEFGKRFNQYPKGSNLFLHLYVKNIDIFEKNMIDLFGLEFKRRLDIGYEYFEGDLNNMIQLIFNYYFNDTISKISETNIIIKEKEEPNKVEALNLKLEKTNLKLEKQKIKEEKDKRKIETIKKEKEKLEKKRKEEIEKETLQKLEEEKNLQKEKKTNLFNELREKVANMAEENYFRKHHYSMDKIIKLTTLRGLNNYITKEIGYIFINKKITDIYDYEVCEVLHKRKFTTLKEDIILKIYSNLNPNVLSSQKLIKDIRKTYTINGDILKKIELKKIDIIYYDDIGYEHTTLDEIIYYENEL